MEALINIALTILLIVIAYFTGRRSERRHYASIATRHVQYNHIAVFNTKTPPSEEAMDYRTQVVYGSVVIGQDYFKLMLAGFMNFFGGNLTAYESLLDRARKEAILRMKAQAHQLNATIIINTKLESCSMSNGQQRNQSGSIEVLAYGTALIINKQVIQPHATAQD